MFGAGIQAAVRTDNHFIGFHADACLQRRGDFRCHFFIGLGIVSVLFDLNGVLAGLCQEKNTATILTSVLLLRKRGITISDEAVERGMAEVTAMTGLMGRWQILSREPLTICDTAHNKGGLSYIFRHLAALPHRRLHLVFGMVGDKDVDGVLTLLQSLIPSPYSIYFTQASVQRAMPAEEVCRRASSHGLSGTAFGDVVSAYAAAKKNASADDIIYIGGSTFVVADMLKSIL